MRGVDYSIIGKRFGYLTVIGLDHIKHHSTWWKCVCDCGKETVVYRGALTSGDIISCGCYHQEHNSEFSKKHGLSSHPLYKIWSGIVQRCTNKNAENYKRYGGRGITICDEWRNNFQSFYDWSLSNGYSKSLTIDRKNNEKGYSPDNCRWSTTMVQSNNTRRNHLFSYNGISHTIAEWSRLLGVNHETLRYRINHGNLKDFKKIGENN